MQHKEEWKPIKGYEGLYEVSSLGRIKSLPRFRNNQFNYEEIIMKQKKTPTGYLQVSLSKDGEQILYNVHRIVAEAFIPNPNNMPQINHKDEDKSNNVITNLEWCTSDYNMNYGTRNKRASDKLKGKLKGNKPIVQYDCDGNYIREWKGAFEAGNVLGLDKSAITKVLKGKHKKCGGYIWRYKNVAEELAA